MAADIILTESFPFSLEFNSVFLSRREFDTSSSSCKRKTFSKENFLERKICFRVNFWKEKNIEWNYFLGETCVKVNSWKTQPQHLLPAFNWHIFLFSKVRTFCPSLPIFLFQIKWRFEQVKKCQRLVFCPTINIAWCFAGFLHILTSTW